MQDIFSWGTNTLTKTAVVSFCFIFTDKTFDFCAVGTEKSYCYGIYRVISEIIYYLAQYPVFLCIRVQTAYTKKNDDV